MFGFLFFLVSDEEQKIIDAQKRIEMKLAAFFVEHNIPFRAMDHLVELLKCSITDSKVIITTHSNKY